MIDRNVRRQHGREIRRIEFERLLDRPDMRVESRRYTAVKGLNVLTRIPVVRELMTNRVTVVIRKG